MLVYQIPTWTLSKYSPISSPGQLERTITKAQLLEDACTNNEKIKGELTWDTYKFRAKPDIKKCEEYTRLVVTKDYIGKHFGEEIAFEVGICVNHNL